MRCPNCQTEIPEGHFYCPKCQVLVYNYLPPGAKPNGGRLERAGRRLLDLLLILILIGGGVVLARAIKWKELWNNINPSAEVSPSPKPERGSPASSPAKRRNANSTQTTAETQGNSSKSDSAESGRDVKQKPEESASPANTRPTPKPTATPNPPKPDANLDSQNS